MINLIVKIKKNLLKYYDNNLAFTKFGDLYSNLENNYINNIRIKYGKVRAINKNLSFDLLVET